MARRLRPMTASDLVTLPGSCAACTFWEAGPADLASSSDHWPGEKRLWAEQVTRQWGHCGVLAVDDDEVLGFLTLSPASAVPRLGTFATTPVSPDAAVLLSAHVRAELRGHGLGRQLVQSAAGLLARRDIRALEAVGTYHEGPSCMLPAGWLQAVGFAVVRPHPVTPRLRMDLHSTARWRHDLGAAWRRVAGLVPQPSPEPATYAHREPATLSVPRG